MANEREIYNLAQQSLVAALLYDGTDTDRVLSVVNETYFEDQSLGCIMAAIAEVSRRSETPTAVNVAEVLQNSGKLRTVGGISRIYQLVSEGEKNLLKAQPEVYARIVQESAVKYRIHTLLKDTQGEFRDDSGMSAKDAVEKLQNDLSQQILLLGDNATITPVDEFVNSDEYDLILEKRAENAQDSSGLQGLPYPLEGLNRYTRGLMTQQLVTVAANTGIGKSVFALMIAISIAKAGKSVLFFSLEMNRDEIVDRIVANLSGVSLDDLNQGLFDAETGQVNQKNVEKVRKAREDLSKMHIVIDTDADQTVDSIRAKAIRQSQSPEGLNCLIVDYLQLVKSVGRFNSRQEEVANISRNLKILAKKMSIPVVALSQLNRKKDTTEEQIPTMDNIRESGAIAQDSDVVILLHRGKNEDNTVQDTLVILEKNRNGSSNKKIRTATNLEFANFRERKSQNEAQNDIIDGSDPDDISDDFSMDDVGDDDRIDSIEQGMQGMDSDISLDTI